MTGNSRKTWQKTQVFPWCSLMFLWFWCVMCHLDFHASLTMSPKYGDEIGFLKNGWWKSLWIWGATKLSHALGMPPSKKSRTKNHPDFFHAYISGILKVRHILKPFQYFRVFLYSFVGFLYFFIGFLQLFIDFVAFMLEN